MSRVLTVLLVVAGVALVAVGAGAVYLPAGLIVCGAELIAAAYVKSYLEARNEDS